MSDIEDEVGGPADVVRYEEVEAMLLDSAVRIEENAERAAREIVQSILDAETADDVLGRAEITHARDYLDTPFVALGVNFHSSSFKDGIGAYAVIDATNESGEKLLITCGARNVVAQLYRLLTLNAYPRQMMIVEAAKAKEGQSAPLRLVKPDSF